MIHGIDHTALSVPDIEKAIAFYGDVLGFEVQMPVIPLKDMQNMDDLTGLEQAAFKVAMISLGDTKIELFEYESPVPETMSPDRPVNDHGITHICLRVSDLQSEYERLKAAGVPFNSPPIDMGIEQCAYGRDPFGNTIEFLERKQR